MGGASPPVLTLVTNRRLLAGRSLLDLVRQAAAAAVDLVQVREKDLSDRELARLVRQVLEAAAGTGTRVLVNGRPDVAEAAGAHGVQLPEEGLPVGEVRRGFPRLLVGASRHSIQASLRAEADGADFVVLGPIFATPGKEERVLGVQLLAEAAAAIRIPVHAIGGVNASTARAALSAGARGLAAIRAFVDQPPADAARSLRGE